MPRRYESTRRAQSAAATRDALLDATARLVADRGFVPTTVTEIARTAGVAPATVYTSVGGKVALLTAVAQRAAADPAIGEALESVATADTVDEVLAAVCRGSRRTNETHATAIRAVWDSATVDRAVAELTAHVDGLFRDRMRAVADRVVDLVDGDLDRREVTDVLVYHLGVRSWRELRRLGWGWDRAERWLTGRVTDAIGH